MRAIARFTVRHARLTLVAWALVLAAALPQTRVVAVESVGKKAAFISETGQAMGLTNLEVVPLRAEEWSSAMGEVDVVTARALAPTAILVEYAAPILRLGGSPVAWKGRRDPQEDEAGAVAADLVGHGGERGNGAVSHARASRGRPSTRSAMMLRCTSLDPP